jgi:hypothetical protein
MRRYKIQIDISNLFEEIIKYKIREYSHPFITLFINAKNPDEAIEKVILSLIKSILKKDCSPESRILCKKIRRQIRIDKIQRI